jgi:hypothetical protein
MEKKMRTLREGQYIERVWGQISDHTVEGYFWIFNLVESKKFSSGFLVCFSGSKDLFLS